MFTRHLAAAIAILAVVLIGPIMLPGKSRVGTTDLPSRELPAIVDVENS